MKDENEKIPNPKELEKEIGDFLAKKFGGNVKIASPMVVSHEDIIGKSKKAPKKDWYLNFKLKPKELVAHLDQYIVRQDMAKAVLATKICTHFNRIKHIAAMNDDISDMVGSIKNNVLMIGPTGVGKTYMIKLIAQKIGVPFVKGDATKFSETGYVGGDVEDLVRDLVRETDNDIELAQYGIIYIDEIDKIASSRNWIGADISRSGVQRALLKPLEETEVDLKVPHDPIAMFQELEAYRKTGKRDKRSINTKNILFIVSGAFGELVPIINRRLKKKGIGFGAALVNGREQTDIFQKIKSEDLIEYGFESEFVGRLPVRAVFERLEQDDLFQILKNPNNPIILGKKLDFAAYGIDIIFEDEALRLLAEHAYAENTGARGLVSAVENALLQFEKKLPSTNVNRFPVTEAVIKDPQKNLKSLLDEPAEDVQSRFDTVSANERAYIKDYIVANQHNLEIKYNLTLTPSRIHTIATLYGKHIMDIGKVFKKTKSYCDEVKKLELDFYKNLDINIVMEDDAIDHIIDIFSNTSVGFDDFYKDMIRDFEYGLKLVREKIGKNRFFITKDALTSPETFISDLLKQKSDRPPSEDDRLLRETPQIDQG